jgi:hypothetical protein
MLDKLDKRSAARVEHGMGTIRSGIGFRFLSSFLQSNSRLSDTHWESPARRRSHQPRASVSEMGDASSDGSCG